MNKKSTEIALLLLRLTAGGIMAFSHGLPKLIKLVSGETGSFPDPLGVGSLISMILVVFAEFVCGLLVALGLFTRWALLPLIITMAIAILVIHQGDPFKKMEMAFIYLLMFFSLLLSGPGTYSMDKRFLAPKF
jgi:putative oxidoreductase